MNDQTHVSTLGGFADSSILIVDVPPTDKLVTVDHPTENTVTLDGLAPTQPDVATRAMGDPGRRPERGSGHAVAAGHPWCDSDHWRGGPR